MKRTPLNVVVQATISLVIVNTLTVGQCLPAMSQQQSYYGQQLQGRVTMVPIGTTIDAQLTSAIDSAVAKPGDLFNARLNAPLYLGNDLVLPGGTNLEGQVVSSDKAGLVGSNGKMGLRLIGAVTPDGIHYPLSAIVTANQDKTIHEDKQGNLKGRTTSSSVKSGALRTALWAGGGTILGICFAPIVGGAVGAGAIAGVATGGGVGLASNLWRKGKDVTIPSGTRVQFSLDQPMALTASVDTPNRTTASSAPVPIQ